MGKRFFLLFAVCLFILQGDVSAKYLVKIEIEYVQESGHFVSMFYAVDNLDSLESKINRIDRFSERKILNSIGIPIDVNYIDPAGCVIVNAIKEQKIFRRKKAISVSSKCYKISMYLTRANYELCMFKLGNKFWGSYDVDFKEAGVIQSISSYKKFSEREREKIISIKNSFSNIVFCR